MSSPHPPPTRRARRGRAAPVWLLLLVLALVPTTGMGVFAWRQAGASAATADQAATVADETEQQVRLMAVATAVSQEQFPTYARSTGRAFGMTIDEASALAGTDLDARLALTRRHTDEAMAALPADLRAEPGIGRFDRDLAAARDLADDPTSDTDAVQDLLYGLSRRAEAAARTRVGDRAGARPVLTDSRVSSATEALDAVVALFRADIDQTATVAHLFFLSGEEADLRRQLAGAIAVYQREAGIVAGLDHDVAREGWAALRAEPDLAQFDAYIDDLVSPAGARVTGGIHSVSDFAVVSVVRNDGLSRLVADVGRSAVATADGVARDAAAAHRAVVATSVALGALALGLVVVVTWSISRPLHLLARRARLVSEGDVGATGGPARGPHEVRIVGAALDEAAANLGRVEEQAKALADGHLDDAVLRDAVPGALGRSVYESVEQLSRSLRHQDELQRRLTEQATHDVLTGLLNRTGCLIAADQALARARRTGTQIAVLAVDLDDFKRVNDLHGHAVGDDVLRAVAERALATVRAGDVVARIGSDVFVVIAESVDDIDDAVTLAERLVTVASEPLVVGGRTLAVGASVGVAVNQDAHEDGLTLLAEAEQAVAGAKRLGRGRVDVFDEGLRRELAGRSEIEDALRAGLAGGELELHYQPVVDTGSGRLQGFEALARWNRPGHGMVPPMVFVPVAETSDLVIELGRWVLASATSQLVAWSADPAFADTHVAVNISGRHLVHPSIVDDVRDALDRSGLSPQRLVVEITETVLVSDAAVAVAVGHLGALRAMGVRVAIDDFGTGYTSIGQLGRLPVDILKIDRAFVSGLDHDGDRSLVELMVGVAHTLGLGLVAEGVEDEAQLAALQRLDCDDVQGYFIARPMPVADVPGWAATVALGGEGPPTLT